MAFIRCGGGGNTIVEGNFTRSTSTGNTINLGFKPKKLIIYTPGSSPSTTPNGTTRIIYDESWSTSYVMVMTKGSSGSSVANTAMSSSSLTLTSTGFVFAKTTSSTYAIQHNYIAIG